MTDFRQKKAESAKEKDGPGTFGLTTARLDNQLSTTPTLAPVKYAVARDADLAVSDCHLRHRIRVLREELAAMRAKKQRLSESITRRERILTRLLATQAMNEAAASVPTNHE